MKNLIQELKYKVIDTLNLVDISVDDIDEDEQLVGGKLGIDSIDVLELVMMLEKDYFVKIEDKQVGAKAFASVRSLAQFVVANAKEQSN